MFNHVMQRSNTVHDNSAADQNIAVVPTTDKVFISHGASTSRLFPMPRAIALDFFQPEADIVQLDDQPDQP